MLTLTCFTFIFNHCTIGHNKTLRVSQGRIIYCWLDFAIRPIRQAQGRPLIEDEAETLRVWAILELPGS